MLHGEEQVHLPECTQLALGCCAASASSDHGLLWQAVCALEQLPMKPRCITEGTLPYSTLP